MLEHDAAGMLAEGLGSIQNDVAIAMDMILELSEMITAMHAQLQQETRRRMNAEMMSNMLKDQHDRTKMLSWIYGRESIANEGSHFTPDGVNADSHTQWQLNVQIGDDIMSFPWSGPPLAESVLRRGPQDVQLGPRPPSANKRVQIPPEDEKPLESQELDPFSSSWLRPSTAVDAMAQKMLYERMARPHENQANCFRRPASAPVDALRARGGVEGGRQNAVSLQSKKPPADEAGRVNRLHRILTHSRPSSASSHVSFADCVDVGTTNRSLSESTGVEVKDEASTHGADAAKLWKRPNDEASGLLCMVQDEVRKLHRLVDAKSLELKRWEALLERVNAREGVGIAGESAPGQDKGPTGGCEGGIIEALSQETKAQQNSNLLSSAKFVRKIQKPRPQSAKPFIAPLQTATVDDARSDDGSLGDTDRRSFAGMQKDVLVPRTSSSASKRGATKHIRPSSAIGMSTLTTHMDFAPTRAWVSERRPASAPPVRVFADRLTQRCGRDSLSTQSPHLELGRGQGLKGFAAAQLEAAVRATTARRQWRTMPHRVARVLQAYVRRKAARLSYLEARVRLRRYLARQSAMRGE